MSNGRSLVDLLARLRRSPKSDRKTLLLDPIELADAFHQQRHGAPRRTEKYLSNSRLGVTSGDNTSNRREEGLAKKLCGDGGIGLPTGGQLTFLDYQFPLKSVRADVGIGKVDLLGIREDGTLVVVELKIESNREDRRIAVLEGLIYAAIVEANLEQIAEEVLAIKGRQVRPTRPAIVILAPPLYWSRTAAYPPLAEFLRWVTEVARATPIEIVPMSLNGTNANYIETFEM